MYSNWQLRLARAWRRAASAIGRCQVAVERLGGAQQQNAEAISGPPLADALAYQAGGEIADRFGGLEHLLGSVRIDRRPGVEHPVDGGHTQPRMGGDSGDSRAFIVVHDQPLKEALIENYQAALGLDDSLIGNLFKALRAMAWLLIIFRRTHETNACGEPSMSRTSSTERRDYRIDRP